MTSATWNSERIEQLRNFVVAGLTCSQIAAEIGVTRNAVIGKIHRLGLGSGRPERAPARACPPRSPALAFFSATPAPAPAARRRGRHRRRSYHRGHTNRQRATLLAARAGAGEMPLANQRSRRRGFRILRKRDGRGLLLLRGPRPHGLSAPGAAARIKHLDDLRSSAVPRTCRVRCHSASRLHGPAPAKTKYRKTKQYRMAGSPPLRAGKNERGAWNMK